MRRAVISIISNIAEGFSKRSPKEKYRFYNTAEASITELQNQLLIARDVGYLLEESFKKIVEQSVNVDKMLKGLLRATRLRKFEP